MTKQGSRLISRPKGRPKGTGRPIRTPDEVQAREAELVRLGTWVREQREALGLTQAQLAAELGRTRGLVSLWEGGASLPTPEDEQKIRALVAARRAQG